MKDIAYRSFGVPLESYELSKFDHRSQQTSDGIRTYIQKLKEEWRAEEEADPGLRERRSAGAREVLERFFRHRTPDRELMRWRVRLYCRHITETTRHYTIESPTMHGSSSMACSECGRHPSHIVAYEPLGLSGQQPPSPPPAPRPTRAQLEQRIQSLEEQLEALRGNEKARP